MGRYITKGKFYPFSRLYRIWLNMRNRCNNSRDHHYNRYGGRGIKICKEWDDFEKFENWAIDHGYNENLSLDRINNDDGYYPGNCRWVNATVQANNRRSSVYYTFNGETHTLAEWARIKGISYKNLTNRIYRGVSFETALNTPIDYRKSNKKNQSFDGG